MRKHSKSGAISQHKRFAAVLLAAVAVLASGCRIVEVASQPRQFELVIEAPRPGAYSLQQYDRSGQYRSILPARTGVYQVKIPMMEGGYSQFLFIRYNRHVPEEYKIIRVMKGGAVIKELSIRDLEALPVKGKARMLRAE